MISVHIPVGNMDMGCVRELKRVAQLYSCIAIGGRPHNSGTGPTISIVCKRNL